ncbi:hypothetical protein FXV83_26565 [Bradyrhizobium hipponense]|uniref:Uncharacterized protein n=1 Tax=Bradyrhizobium hipponense TaxID=2605638 RepID=A0A5S4YHT7_9BRAD|nr:hypothetical protein FXV83_26565 [Bradyrhizobium hipponense]
MRRGAKPTLRLSCPGLTGASSTPRPHRIPSPPLEYWIARSSRAMTPSLWRDASPKPPPPQGSAARSPT